MARLRIPGFPAGSIRINSSISVWRKDGLVTYFVGSDNYFSPAVDDERGQRLALATLMVNSHVRAVKATRSPPATRRRRPAPRQPATGVFRQNPRARGRARFR